MNLFESIAFLITNVLSQTLPISLEIQHYLMPHFLQWQAPSPAFLGYTYIGAAIGVFCLLIHDWASILSSFLRVLIYRKKPNTIDETLPFVLLSTLLPFICAYVYPFTKTFFFSSLISPLFLLFFSFIFELGHHFSYKKKNMSDWTLWDGFLLGLGIAIPLSAFGTMHIPGWNLITAGLFWSFLLGYRIEPALKYLLLLLAPTLGFLGFNLLQSKPFFLSLSTPLICLLLLASSSLSFISAKFLLANLHSKIFSSINFYRVLLAALFLATHLIKPLHY